MSAPTAASVPPPLSDEASIVGLVHEFSRCLDARDWTGYGETFTEDGVFEIFGGRREGRASIREGATELGRFELTQHYNTNITVGVTGDTARATSSLLAVHVLDLAQSNQHADVGGRYNYQCLRTEDGWRFAHVRLEITWTGGLALGI